MRGSDLPRQAYSPECVHRDEAVTLLGAKVGTGCQPTDMGLKSPSTLSELGSGLSPRPHTKEPAAPWTV